MKLRINPDAVLDAFEEALTAAAIRGWRRAHKHVEAPSDDDIYEAIHAEVRTVVDAWCPVGER